ncbi:MAG: acetyl-CoA C-acetyltransferase [Chloroflexi bacterium]|nr:acetyl-CoA C-acetyltransferase [Chloroflexota bacterium]
MSSPREAVIVSAARLPIGRFLGALSSLPATQLGALAVREAIRRAEISPDHIDEVILGNVVSAGLGQAPARQAALRGGVPESVPTMTINKVCGSGLKAVMLAAQAIRAGDGEVFIAGGFESMSNAPYLLKQARMGYRLGHGELLDANVYDGLWCAMTNQHMGMCAELIAERFGISREEQDAFALRSHRRAVAATLAGRFAAEIVPVEVPVEGNKRAGPKTISVDEPPRPDTSLEALARLRPAFCADGTVTPGNAPGLSDGAAALVVMDAAHAERQGIRPLARITGYTSAALEPRMIFAAPVVAIRKLLDRTKMTLDDYDLIEVNEAFSAQILANGRELGWDDDRVNVNGGAVALGHPIGASGARLLTTLLYALRNRGLHRGLAALCLGGGGSVAMSIEMI